MRLTVPTVELDRVGRQVDGDAVLVGLRELEVLDLAVRAEHVHIQDCESADNREFGGTRRERKHGSMFFVTSGLEGARTETLRHTNAAGLTFPHKPKWRQR